MTNQDNFEDIVKFATALSKAREKAANAHLREQNHRSDINSLVHNSSTLDTYALRKLANAARAAMSNAQAKDFATSDVRIATRQLKDLLADKPI